MSAAAAPAAMGSGKELANPPTDGISNLRFSNHSNNLLVSSWDKTVRLYDADANVLKGEFVHPGPVLDCCFHDDSSGFSAGADHTVRRLVFSSDKEDVLGRHDGPVRCVEYSYAAGYALSSVEGRVSMEFFDLSEAAQSKKYAFKCHRKSEAGRDTVYPVNAIAFHPIYGTFATGGCDGFVNVWDGINKKRLYQYSKYASSIAALSFSKDGHLLAVASSYTYEEGEKSHEPDAIFIRTVNEVEVKPKPKALAAPQ
nr:unnamed protein product [Digitaria exilis]